MPEVKAAAPAAPVAPVVVDTTVYIDSGLYHPKAEHTVVSWEEVQVLLPCTYADLAEAGKNHKNQGFLPYLKQRKAIVPEGTDLASLRAPRKAAKPKEEVAEPNVVSTAKTTSPKKAKK